MQITTAKSGGYRTAEMETGKVFLKRLMPFITLQKARCSIHGEYETYANKKTGEVMGCPFCEEEKERLKRQQESCLNKIDGLLPKYREAGFKNFEITPQNKAAYNAVLAFAKKPNNKWLLLLGSNGTGKTHLANAVLKVTGGIYAEFNDLSLDFLNSQNSKCKEEIRGLFNKYAYCPLLVIDEIDKVKATEGRIGWLNSILSKRYNHLLPVILCGNIDLKMLCSHIDLNNGIAMKDRIDEVGEVIIFNWESYRLKIRNA